MIEIDSGAGSSGFQYIKDPKSLTKFLKAMLWATLVMTVLKLLSDYMQLSLLSSDTISEEVAKSNDTRQQTISILRIGAYIVTGFSFLTWVYRANSNCRGFGAEGMQYTPAASVGCYFVPLFCFYKPYQAMKEIWQVSTSPAEWQNESGSLLLTLWWALWLTSCFLAIVANYTGSDAKTIGALQDLTTMYILADLFDIPKCVVAVLLISKISAMQEKLVKDSVGRPIDPDSHFEGCDVLSAF